MRPLLAAALPIALLPLLSSCATQGCLGGEAGCLIPTPCPQLNFTCETGSGEVSLHVVGQSGAEFLPEGLDVLASPGDILLVSDAVVAVIEALDHPHYLGASGGGLLDLSTRDGKNDSLRQILQAVGFLPQDAARYDRLELFDEDGFVAVQLVGELDGRPGVTIATRYELHPCEPGLRVRTELYNGSPDAHAMLLADGFYWGDRENLPFTPIAGAGFEHPSFGLSTLGDALRNIPYMVSAAHVDPAAAYAQIACDVPLMEGLQSENVSLAGKPLRTVMPRDYETFDRFLAVADGASVAAAGDVALEVRRQLWAEDYVKLSGRLTVPEDDPTGFNNAIRAQVLISEVGDDAPVPRTHAVPRADGTFEVMVPADRRYLLEVEALGLGAANKEVTVGSSDVDAGVLSVAAVGGLTLNATVDGATDVVLALVRPVGETADAVEARFLSSYGACAPLLGHPYGSSPSCDRVLVEGPTTIAVPPGTYDIYAAAGPFSSLSRVEGVTVDVGRTVAVNLAVTTLPIQPAGTLSADFHVHGSASFDSSLGPIDRMRSILAARLDVVASTEHDVVSNFSTTLAALDALDRVRIIEGTESTGHVLFPLVPNDTNPKVIGHFNFWPVPYDAQGPWRGAAYDELQEPGELMDAMARQGWPDDIGVAQLNHPVGGFAFGRDYGWVDAISLNLLEPLEGAEEGTGQSLFLRTPPGADHSNADYHVQEVMNGTDNLLFQGYRGVWFGLLNQGILRGGTANSDSHSLSDELVGSPRTLVFTDATLASFDLADFQRSVREGRMVGTNGPIIVATLDDASGSPQGPSVDLFEPGDAPVLDILIHRAPWVPVDEVRIIVNGEVVQTITDGLVSSVDESDPDAPDAIMLQVDLTPHLPSGGDAWVVVEAGAALPASADLNCDGIPDTGDTNGDGTIDWRDVADLEEEPEGDCLDTVGPLREPDPPARGDPGYAFYSVVPGGYPLAFTNPWVLDLDGDGTFEVAR